MAMKALQLSDLIDMENPQRVLEEVKTIVLMIFPEFPFERIDRVFKDIVRLFNGEYPGYRAPSVQYHNVRHTTDVFLAMARLIHGAGIGGKGLSETQANLGLICALMHDTCFIRPLTNDSGEADMPYPHLDRRRSIEFMDTYIAENGLPREEFIQHDKIIMCTSLTPKISEIHFDSQGTEQVGKMLAAAMILSQMADRTYLENSLFPYYEYGHTDIMGSDKSLEFLKKIIHFYDISRKSLTLDLDDIHQYMRFHFKLFWNLDRDLYMEAAERNINYLASLLEEHEREYGAYQAPDEIAGNQADELQNEVMGIEKKGPWRGEKAPSASTIQEARASYQKLITLANDVQSRVERNEPIDISSVWRQLRAIIENDLIEPLYHWLVFERNRTDSIAEHSLEVTILSLMVGLGMGYTRKKLALLALLAFLHDVGMYKIPQEILRKKGALSEGELTQIQKHPEISAGILSRLGPKFSWLANLSLQVHERADGTGYPKGIKGEGVHEFAFVVGLADIYSAMIKDKPYRNSIEKNKAIKTIIASIKEKFPATILKVFLNQISFFPAGSYVKLNDLSVGRVITANPEFPLKPTVEILYDHEGARVTEPQIVNLSQQPSLYIIESIDERETNAPSSGLPGGHRNEQHRGTGALPQRA
jgi:HD-GYP domain-containing protein (c-di-GMP phosphodiesterase class II)